MLEQKGFRHAGALHQMIQLLQMLGSTDRRVNSRDDCTTSLTGYVIHALHWTMLHVVAGPTHTPRLQIAASQPRHQEL